MYASIVMVQHPRRRAARALLTARRVAAQIPDLPEVELARAGQCSRFRADTKPPQVPGRVAVVAFARSPEVLEGLGAGMLTPLLDGASEAWSALLEPVRVDGDWYGFRPSTTGAAPLRSDEPVVAMINGVLKFRYLRRFLRDSARVSHDLATAPGYLGGFGFSDTPLATTSLSCWRSSNDSRAFAFRDGHHPTAYKTDLAEGRHRTEFYVRFRPLRSSGTIDGANPLSEVAPSGWLT